MITQIETSTANQERSTWNKIVGRLNEIGVAMDYDPQSDTNDKMGLLWNKVQKLEIRLQELEQRSQR